MAVTVANPAAEMAPAVAVNVLFAEPAGTVTEAGTGRRELLLVSVTMLPPAGAALVRVTVHEADCFEDRFAESHVTADRLAEDTVVSCTVAVREVLA